MLSSCFDFIFTIQNKAHTMEVDNANKSPFRLVNFIFVISPPEAINSTPIKLTNTATSPILLSFCFSKGMERRVSIIGQV